MYFLYLNSLVYRLQFLIFNMQKGKEAGILCGTEDISFGNKTSIKSFIKIIIKKSFQSLEITLRDLPAFAPANYH